VLAVQPCRERKRKHAQVSTCRRRCSYWEDYSRKEW
jgi:hypothetical protein